MSAVFVFTTYGGPQGQQLTEREAPHAAVRRDRHRGSRRRREPRRLEAPGRRLRHARVRAGRDGPGSGRGRDRRGGGGSEERRVGKACGARGERAELGKTRVGGEAWWEWK